MTIYELALEQTSFRVREAAINLPKPEVAYFAYKEGKLAGKCLTRESARNISNVIERVVVNQDEIDAARAAVAALSAELKDAFVKLLKEDSGRNDAVFDVIWARAWEEGHAYGLPSVESAFEDLDSFASDMVVAGL